jgi:hypothetical protein
MTTEPTPIQKKNMHHWPGIGKVTIMLSRSIKQVNQLVVDGDLKAYNYNGDRRFDPEQVQALLQDLKDVPGDNDDDPSTLLAKSKGEGIVLDAMIQYTRELRQQTRDMHSANIELQKQANETFRASQESKDHTITFLSKRVEDLERTQLEFLHAREELLDAREDRDIVRARANARNEITKDIWATTKKNFGEMLELAVQRWGIDPKTMAKLKAANELIQSVAATPVRLEALIETGLVSEKETELIRTILDQEQPPAGAAGVATDSTAPSAEASSSSATDQTEPTKTTIDVDPEPTQPTPAETAPEME